MAPLHELRIGTRGSQLALWQARTVAARIVEEGGPPCRIVVIRTSGDKLQDAPLSTVGGKRLFVKEIEDALLNGDVDLAVHSSKDMPAALLDGLAIGAVLPRADPRDALVLPADASGAQAPASIDRLFAGLGRAPAIGTGSVRRIAQLLQLFPGATFSPIRGNLDTRLRKLDAGEHDALVLAAAGLRRLGFDARITTALPVDVCVPSPGQGIVAIEIQATNQAVRDIVRRIDDPGTAVALAAERALVERLGGGCQTPIGAIAVAEGDAMTLTACVVAPDGSRAIRASGHGRVSEAVALGERVGADLLGQGADAILAGVRRAQDAGAHT